ncbi:sialidase family protein [Dactylosporangium sp. NPDC000244]|uniref:sialidase family protein n=1 Tax=Dactylosporangium sp. NPDC000244 TaxID=3154365 RepID=UPI00331E380B
MKRPLILTATGLGLLALLGSAPAAAEPQRARPGCDGSVPYRANTEGYSAFRIPAVVKARSGAILAFAEGRKGGLSDAGDIDLVLKRSTDGGCTWGPLQVVYDSGANTSGNPAPVVTASGRVVLLSTYNAGTATEAAIMRGEVTAEQSRRVFVQHSDDDGATWSAPAELTATAKRPDWRWYATGPGHAVRLTKGAHKDRLVVPANHSAAPPAGSTDAGTEAKYYGAHDLISDDNGATWRIGFVDGTYDGVVNANESSAAELPDGRLYFNARDQNGTAPGNRLDAVSLDGGQSLSPAFYRPQGTITGPVVQGSVLQVTGRNAALVYSGPADPAARAVMTLRVSRDGGATFTPALALSGLPAAYSDLVQLDDATLGVLYETGDLGANETIALRRVATQSLG